MAILEAEVIENSKRPGWTRDGKQIDAHANHDGRGKGPALTLGPHGRPKTGALIVPQLLLDEPGKRSFVVINPKGIAAVAAKRRGVKIINPFAVPASERPDLNSEEG